MILNIDKRILMILPIICGVMWGTGGVFVRAFNSFGFNSVSILAIRVAGALIILFILMMIFDRDAVVLYWDCGCSVSGLRLFCVRRASDLIEDDQGF